MSDIAASIDLPDGDRLVLLSLSAGPRRRGTIARLSATGRRRWIAHAPAGVAEDAFVSLSLEGEAARADTFQGLRLRIDLRTGAVSDARFVK